MSIPMTLCACGNPADPIPSNRVYMRNRRRALRKTTNQAVSIADEPVCPRCLFLDGKTINRYEIVSILRDCGRLNNEEIVAVTGLSSNNVAQMLIRLRKVGRVEQIYDPAIDISEFGRSVCWRLTKD